MNLYRLDYVRDADGRDLAAVRGSDLGILPTGDVLTRHMTTARQRAIQAAALADCPVLITRISGGGRMKGTLIIGPDGRGKRPPGMAAASGTRECRAGTGLGACFCDNCRAARRA